VLGAAHASRAKDWRRKNIKLITARMTLFDIRPARDTPMRRQASSREKSDGSVGTFGRAAPSHAGGALGRTRNTMISLESPVEPHQPPQRPSGWYFNPARPPPLECCRRIEIKAPNVKQPPISLQRIHGATWVSMTRP